MHIYLRLILSISNQTWIFLLIFRHYICSNSWNWTPFSVHRILHFIIIHSDRERHVYWSIIWMGIFWRVIHQMDRRVNIVVQLPIKEPPSMYYHGIFAWNHKRIYEPKDFLQPWTIVSIETCTGKQFYFCLHFIFALQWMFYSFNLMNYSLQISTSSSYWFGRIHHTTI